MAWPAIAAFAGGAALQWFGQHQANQANASAAREATAANLQSAREQMAFQERMSSTAHTRQVTDLRNAGLNPILSANSGASSPAGASAQAATPDIKNELEGIAASAMEFQRQKMDMKRQNAEISLMEAQKEKTKIETIVAGRGVPEADMKYRLYKNLGKPFVDKIEQMVQSGSKAPVKETPGAAEAHKRALERWQKNNPQPTIKLKKRD